MLTCKTTIYKHTKGATLYLSLASKLVADSAFPFEAGDKVTVEVKGDKLEVRKA